MPHLSDHPRERAIMQQEVKHGYKFIYKPAQVLFIQGVPNLGAPFYHRPELVISPYHIEMQVIHESELPM